MSLAYLSAQGDLVFSAAVGEGDPRAVLQLGTTLVLGWVSNPATANRSLRLGFVTLE
jgi:hypothetical protein